jgi:hypothetical protein
MKRTFDELLCDKPAPQMYLGALSARCRDEFVVMIIAMP